MMHITAHSNFEKRQEADVLVVAFWRMDDGTIQSAAPIPERLNSEIQVPIASGDFTAKGGEVVCFWVNEPEKRVLLLGLGKKSQCTAEKLRKSFYSVICFCRQKKYPRIALFIPTSDLLPQELITKAVLEGLYFGSYKFSKYKQDDSLVEITNLFLLTKELHSTEAIYNTVSHVMQANFFVRDLVNANADDITPQFLAECAQKIEKKHARIQTEVYGRQWIQEQQMGLLYAVSKGSTREPQFIQMHYRGNPTSQDLTVLVGKGITFDTGGLNLKGKGFIEGQRQDMAGAAVVMATLDAIAGLELCCNVTVIIPTCENAIGPDAYKPGDVYTSFNKTSVEITNTDAEGRLILADALSYAEKVLKPSRIIDVATLTGAMVVALGNEVMGFFSNSDSMAEEIWQAGQRTHERTWRMPLYQEYKEKLSSDIADIKNAQGQAAGAILAAVFLNEFIGQTPWVHIDIAGVASYSEHNKYWQKNATGMGVRLLVDYFDSQCQNVL